MKRVKGCLNNDCGEYKKTYYKATDEYCVKCGTKLCYVCKNRKCFKQVPDDSIEAYCSVHLAEMQDKKEKQGETVKKVGIGIFAAIGATVTAGKAIIDIVKKK